MAEVITLSVLQDEPIRMSQSEIMRGDKGTTFIPNVSEDGILSWTNSDNLVNPEAVNIRGPIGYYFTPVLSSDGTLSWVNNGDVLNPEPINIKGPKGDSFKYSDFTAEQLAALKGDKGDTGAGLNLKGSYDTEEELNSEHPTGESGDGYLIGGDLFTWDSKTKTWVNRGRIQGPKGDAFTYDDFTAEQLAGLKGPKGDPMNYDDMTDTQKNALINSVVSNMAPALEDYATKEYVEQNGGKIDIISMNGDIQPIKNKSVNLQIYGAQIIKWEEND